MQRQLKWEFNSFLMPLRNSGFFPPGREEVSGKWIRNEGAQLRDILKGVELRTLKDLKKKEGKIFTRIDSWSYNQLKCFVGKLPKPLRASIDWNLFEKLLGSRGDGKHGTAKIYKILTELDIGGKKLM
ncbi:unnamed protein product [Staurois parvus]|uniref:Uncharacterized protein n=1 Tax=Staurois parvus TaxID=386267 RepID=A0ABN9BM00_9NEOB|nr:unnamed protein product [Staurois parvus]